MQPSRFDREAERPADQRQAQEPDADPRVTQHASGDGDDDDQRRDDTIEEPGYGHGV